VMTRNTGKGRGGGGVEETWIMETSAPSRNTKRGGKRVEKLDTIRGSEEKIRESTQGGKGKGEESSNLWEENMKESGTLQTAIC